MPHPQSDAFQAAIKEVDAFTKKPTNDELLQLYARFKQGTQDPPLAEAAAPGSFDFKGKAKRKAWQELADSGCTPDEAQDKYVALVKELAKTYA